jgi:hypothetical protein
LPSHNSQLAAFLRRGERRNRGEALAGGVASSQEIVTKATHASNQDLRAAETPEPPQVVVNGLWFFTCIRKDGALGFGRDLTREVHQIKRGALNASAEVQYPALAIGLRDSHV